MEVTVVTKQLLVFAVLAMVGGSAIAQASGYVDQQDRALKAYSAAEVSDLRAGKGMGFAKTAELNGYPGPSHVLQHADALGLSADQRSATEQLMTAHRARAQGLGEALLQAEAALEAAFANRTVSAEELERLTLAVGREQALLRAEHLRTHLAQTQLLNAAQIEQYSALQGYRGAAIPEVMQRHSHH